MYPVFVLVEYILQHKMDDQGLSIYRHFKDVFNCQSFEPKYISPLQNIDKIDLNLIIIFVVQPIRECHAISYITS